MNRKRLIPIVAVVVIGAVVAWLLLRGGQRASTLSASGTVEATEADLGFNFAGQITSIAVQEGDKVKAGQVLARLDATELDARRAAAQAQAQAAQAMLRELERGARPEELAQAQAAERAARQRFEDAKRDYERAQRLVDGGAISQEALDKAQTAFDVAQAAYDQARQQRQLVQAGPRPERIAAQRAVLRQAQAAVRQVDANLAHAVVEAPFDGVVTVKHREEGETVGPGLPVVTVMNPGDRWIRIYVPENQVGRVSIGQKAAIRSDSYPDREYDGVVTFIASQAEFTPRNVQTPEERVKLVYAVKVRITGDARQDLKPGLPADVTLAVGS
ncbi:MAG: efflux RND transporter periplasmic adaptor subunit [Gemmatimonadota bacterium]|jgi:HlyD family secretion protein